MNMFRFIFIAPCSNYPQNLSKIKFLVPLNAKKDKNYQFIFDFFYLVLNCVGIFQLSFNLTFKEVFKKNVESFIFSFVTCHFF